MNKIGTGVSCSNSTPGLTRSKYRSNAPIAQTLGSENMHFKNLESTQRKCLILYFFAKNNNRNNTAEAD